jgi:FKBP-type peptidyl-prolyl cis-trans isomerase FkpA
MSDTKLSHRISALVLAVFFFVSSASVTAFVVWQAHSSNNQPAATQLAGTQLQNFTPIQQVTSLMISDTVVGSGTAVKAGDTVTVDYTGAIANSGLIFQSSLDNNGQPVPISLNNVIKGWSEGIVGMKIGGTRRLIIPANLAYGATGKGSIPPNADLVFDITLHAIK